MGLHDRPYMDDEPRGGFGAGGPASVRGVFSGMSAPTFAVKWLLIANIAMFFLQLVPHVEEALWLKPILAWQIWRFIGFQFLHGGTWHLMGNMLGLYILGTPLERAWGTRAFLRLYLIAGAFAGLCHVVLAYTFAPVLVDIPLVGASGGVFALILVCAVLFPHIRVILVLFPVPIRVAALLFFGITLYGILSSVTGQGPGDAISHAGHLGGMVVGAFWIWGMPKIARATAETRSKHQQGAWQRKLQRQAAQQVEVDRILDKVHEKGLNNLTAKEKATLKDATKRQREEGR